MIDLDGEMPDGALVSPSATPKDSPGRKSDDLLRLADIKLDLGGNERSSTAARLSANPSSTARSKGRFVEYDEADAEAIAPTTSLTAPRAETSEVAPPAAEAEGVEIVRVVKKKKKPRSDGVSTVRLLSQTENSPLLLSIIIRCLLSAAHRQPRSSTRRGRHSERGSRPG